MQTRFHDHGERLDDFTDEFLVVCPQCERCARVLPRDPAAAGLFAPRRLVCRSCGHVKDWAGHKVGGGDRDWYFGLPLWLRAPCCGETLWAYNLRHLQLIEDYVSAQLRESAPGPYFGWNNSSVASRLPKWIKDGKNRADLLKAIARLRERGS